MSDISSADLTDPVTRADLGLEERTQGGPPEPQPQQGALKHLRDGLDLALQQKTDAESRAASLQRELAIERAGLPSSPLKELFLKAYDGEVTSEAIRAEATRYGILNEDGTSPASAASVAVPDVELERHRAVAAAAAGSTTGGDIDLNEALLRAKSPEEVLRIASEAPRDARLVVNPNIA